ncbi:MAG: BtrH N-terminal domain-containing protein [Candidatus Hodarchaeales archaeon]
MNVNTKYVIAGFNYRPGVHCTSSALRNIFEFYGVNFSEAMIFGLGSGMSLAYIALKGMNTIGGRNKDFEKNLCEKLGVQMRIFKTDDAEEGWTRLKEHLDNNRPVAINLDMAFLKYRELPENYHFGMHTVVVCGYNPESQTVLIGDTAYPELKEVSLEDLSKGRNFKYNRWMDPNNLIYEFKFPKEKPDMQVAISKAIQTTGKNIMAKSRLMKLFGVHLGLDAISKLSKEIQSWTKVSTKELLQRSAEISGYISEYGTGGGLFRYLFSDFLKESSSILSNDSLKELSVFYRSLGDQWEALSNKILQLPTQTANLHSPLDDIKKLLTKIKSLEHEGALRLQNFK